MRKIDRYDILEFLSQREDITMLAENAELVHVANVIRRTVAGCREDEAEPCNGSDDAVSLNEQEKRAAECWAKGSGCWIPIADVFTLGVPGPSGSEADTYISPMGQVFKSNNLMHCNDSIIVALERFVYYNFLFPDSAYKFVGFTGFDGRSVYPLVCQQYIKDGIPATLNEIDCYMAALGFEKIEKGRYENDNFLISDILPKNVLKDETGDYYVIDAEIKLKNSNLSSCD